MKIALSLITKNEEKNIARVISSVIPNVDGVFVVDTGSTDNTIQIAKSLGANVTEVGDKFHYTATKEDEKWAKDYISPHAYLKEGEKLFRFHEARNYAFSLIPKDYDWILWLDADDALFGKENIQKIIQEAESQKSSLVFLNYLYLNEFNPDGSIKTNFIQHLRERFVRNDGSTKWMAGIHETLMQTRPIQMTDSKLAQVIHYAGKDHLESSIERNIKNLEFEIKESGAEDPRPIYYLAKAYFDLHKPEYYAEAEKLIVNAYLKASGWAEERAQAWEYVAWIRHTRQDYKGAIQACLNSFHEWPENPSNFITLAMTYMFMGEHQKAQFWLKLGAHVPEPQTTLVKNPQDLLTKQLVVAYDTSINLGQLDQAWAAIYKLVQMFPENKAYVDMFGAVNAEKQQRELTVKALELARHLKQTGQMQELQNLFYAMPQEIVNNQLVAQARNEFFPPRKHEDNEVTIFCGPGFEFWSPKTIENIGSGGSEEAVYRLSRELTLLGYKVTVYAFPGADSGDHDSVTYKHYYEMNWNDQFNILISWRNPQVMDMRVNAKKHYLWLHDVPNLREFYPERLENIDKVIVLSEYQAALLDLVTIEGRRYGVPSEKLWISRNGVSI